MDLLQSSKQNVAEKLEKGAKKLVGDVPGAEEAVNFLAKKAEDLLEEEKADRKRLKAELASMTNKELSIYIPTIYQKDIYNRKAYEIFRQRGIKLLSFDIDDTIGDCMLNNIMAKAPMLDFKMSDEAKELFKELKEMGFIVTLLTNAHLDIAKGACKELNPDGYIYRANKPEPESFIKMLREYDIDKSQMVHIGNSMRDDVVGGNRAGVATWLVRRNGFAWKVAKFAGSQIGLSTKGHLIREELKSRDMWRKHHKIDKGDQYYHMGETQKYSQNFRLYNNSDGNGTEY